MEITEKQLREDYILKNLSRKEIQEKYSITQYRLEKLLKKYGIIKPKHSCIQKKKDSIKKKYSVDNVSQLTEVKLKKKESSRKTYGLPYHILDDVEEMRSLLRGAKSTVEISRILKVNESTVRLYLDKHGLLNKKQIKKRTPEEYRGGVREVHHNSIDCVESFIKMNIKIEHKCNICFNVWKATPINILYGKHGCPSCKSSHGEKRVRGYLD